MGKHNQNFEYILNWIYTYILILKRIILEILHYNYKAITGIFPDTCTLLCVCALVCGSAQTSVVRLHWQFQCFNTIGASCGILITRQKVSQHQCLKRVNWGAARLFCMLAGVASWRFCSTMPTQWLKCTTVFSGFYLLSTTSSLDSKISFQILYLA